MSGMSRRGLLGLMAAAPVAAVAKPEARSRDFDWIRRGEFAWRTPNEIRQMEMGETVEIFGERADFKIRFEDHPPISRAADDEGPGAPAKASGGATDAEASGAPAPDEENPILKAARAC